MSLETEVIYLPEVNLRFRRELCPFQVSPGHAGNVKTSGIGSVRNRQDPALSDHILYLPGIQYGGRKTGNVLKLAYLQINSACITTTNYISMGTPTFSTGSGNNS